MTVTRIFGVVIGALGILAAVFPDWFIPLTGVPEAPVDTFEAIEGRVRGGMVLGMGMTFIAVPAFRPWSKSIPLGIFYLMAGALAARLLGLALDGNVPKQWSLVIVEAVVMAIAVFWLWRKRLRGN